MRARDSFLIKGSFNYHRFPCPCFVLSLARNASSSGSPVNENPRGKWERKSRTSSKFSLEIFTLRGKQREKRERKKEVEKLLVRGKSRFGTLHCVRNMKMELGRMTESFHCPASGVSQGQKVGFLSRTFQFLGEPHPLVLVPPPPPTSGQTYFAGYLEAGHVTAIFILEGYTAARDPRPRLLE